jgi:hypothetical protein
MRAFRVMRARSASFRALGRPYFGASSWTAIKRNVSYGRHIGHLSGVQILLDGTRSGYFDTNAPFVIDKTSFVLADVR